MAECSGGQRLLLRTPNCFLNYPSSVPSLWEWFFIYRDPPIGFSDLSIPAKVKAFRIFIPAEINIGRTRLKLRAG